MFKKFDKEGSHACYRVKLCFCWQGREIGANREGMSPFDHNFFLRCGFESFRLVFVCDWLKWGVWILGGRHRGIDDFGHWSTETLVGFAKRGAWSFENSPNYSNKFWSCHVGYNISYHLCKCLKKFCFILILHPCWTSVVKFYFYVLIWIHVCWHIYISSL